MREQSNSAYRGFRKSAEIYGFLEIRNLQIFENLQISEMVCTRYNCAHTYYCYFIFRNSQAHGKVLKFSELSTSLHNSTRAIRKTCSKVSASEQKSADL